MTPYALKHIPAEDVELFNKVKSVVINLPDIELGSDEAGRDVILSCHILGRAIAKVFSLNYIDGFFYPNYQHTWLLTPNGNIIDVYPIAVLGGPILMVGDHNSPAYWLYKKKSIRRISQGRFGKPSFLKAVRKVMNVIKEAQIIS